MEKKYLILGASSDLGCELIRELVNSEDIEKISIIAHYFSEHNGIDNVIKDYPKLKIYLVQADLSDMQQVKGMINFIQKMEFEPTHIVNLCAGKFQHTRLTEWDERVVDRDMKIQVYAFAEILKSFIPAMVQKKYGKIVVMLTAYTIGVPPKNMSGYVTVKYALLGLMKSMASDYGDKGININGISPGMINTKFIDGIGRKIKEVTAANNPKHRNLETTDVIPAICYLLSDRSEFVSGTNLNLSGKSE